MSTRIMPHVKTCVPRFKCKRSQSKDVDLGLVLDNFLATTPSAFQLNPSSCSRVGRYYVCAWHEFAERDGLAIRWTVRRCEYLYDCGEAPTATLMEEAGHVQLLSA